jgi:CobQ-like glutamine amidotransferase family enzyme
LLPKNPKIADFLISKALQNKNLQTNILAIDERIAFQARRTALKIKR